LFFDWWNCSGSMVFLFRTIPQSNIKIVEKSISVTHKYMTAHFSGLVQASHWKVTGLTSFKNKH
jgi:hypothetical protein